MTSNRAARSKWLISSKNMSIGTSCVSDCNYRHLDFTTIFNAISSLATSSTFSKTKSQPTHHSTLKQRNLSQSIPEAEVIVHQDIKMPGSFFTLFLTSLVAVSPVAALFTTSTGNGSLVKVSSGNQPRGVGCAVDIVPPFKPNCTHTVDSHISSSSSTPPDIDVGCHWDEDGSGVTKCHFCIFGVCLGPRNITSSTTSGQRTITVTSTGPRYLGPTTSRSAHPKSTLTGFSLSKHHIPQPQQPRLSPCQILGRL